MYCISLIFIGSPGSGGGKAGGDGQAYLGCCVGLGMLGWGVIPPPPMSPTFGDITWNVAKRVRLSERLSYYHKPPAMLTYSRTPNIPWKDKTR
jgi:hypothetical protein